MGAVIDVEAIWIRCSSKPEFRFDTSFFYILCEILLYLEYSLLIGIVRRQSICLIFSIWSVYLLLRYKFNKQYLKYRNLIKLILYAKNAEINLRWGLPANKLLVKSNNYSHIPSLVWNHSAVWQASILSQVCCIGVSFPNLRVSPFDVESKITKQIIITRGWAYRQILIWLKTDCVRFIIA